MRLEGTLFGLELNYVVYCLMFHYCPFVSGGSDSDDVGWQSSCRSKT